MQTYLERRNVNLFSFSHDRYIKAARSLLECRNAEKMHCTIAQTMMKCQDQDMDASSLYVKAHHVLKATNVIKARVSHRQAYRELLLRAAQRAIESGARPTALQYYETCLDFLQQDPWTEDRADVDYNETLSLHANAAELYWHQGRLDESQKLLERIFEHANSGVQRARAWIVQSKLLGQRGNITGALVALRTSLLEDFGLDVPSDPTWELCDEEYRGLKNEVQRRGIAEYVRRPLSFEPAVSLMGAVMLEAISAAFWSDSLLVSYHVSQLDWVY